jgi:hypothetical protein
MTQIVDFEGMRYEIPTDAERWAQTRRTLPIDAAMILLMIIIPSFPALLHGPVFWCWLPLATLWGLWVLKRGPRPIRLI